METINVTELCELTIELEGKMGFPIRYTMQMEGHLHNCKPERLYFG